MPRPPASVAFVARIHWVVSAVILLGVGLMTVLVRRLPVEFGWRTYAITLSLAALYFLAGTLVWCGAPLGRVLSKACGLIYLTRPRLGSRLWEIMDSPEYREHFARDAKAKV